MTEAGKNKIAVVTGAGTGVGRAASLAAPWLFSGTLALTPTTPPEERDSEDVD